MQIYKIENIINNKIYVGKDVKDNPNYFGSGLYIKRAIKLHGKENFRKEIIENCINEKELSEREIYWIKEFDCVVPNGYNITNGGNGGDVFTNNPNKEKIRINMKAAVQKRIDDGDFNRKHTEETKLKISNAKKEWFRNNNHPKGFLNKHHTDDTKVKIRNSRLGKKMSNESKEKLRNIKKIICNTPEFKEKMSMARKKLFDDGILNFKGENHPMYGKRHSKETKNWPSP